jgi:hypothetical protein
MLPPLTGDCEPMEFGLDLGAGATLAKSEMYGDWYRDPWAWPEFEWTVKNAHKIDLEYIIVKNGRRIGLRTPPGFHLIEVPKSRLGARPAVVPDVLTRILFLASVYSKLGDAHQTLPSWVFGWRRRGDSELGDNKEEWPLYLGALNQAKDGEWALLTDIVSFFASIDVDRMSALVYDRYGRTASASLIEEITRAHDGLSTRSGLPQRSFASAALAHLYLQPLDDVIEDALSSPEIILAARWMDDINVIGAESALYRLFIKLQERARQLGLELNASKSAMIHAARLTASLQLDDLKEISLPVKVNTDYSQDPFEFDLSVLTELEASLLDNKAYPHPTVIRAVLNSRRKHGVFNRVRDWLNKAPEIPHLADSLGRYLRAAGEFAESNKPGGLSWRLLSDWVVEFSREGWADLDRVGAQLSLIFPASSVDEKQLDILRGWLTASHNIQKVAIATQRLAALRPSSCRDVIRRRADRTTDPLLLRIFAIGLLSSGDDSRVARAILQRDRRNSVLLAALEDSNWRAPQVDSDFDPDRAANPIE